MTTGNSHFKYATALQRTAKKLDQAELVLNDLKHLSKCFADAAFKMKLKEISFMRKAELEKVVKGAFGEFVQKITMNLLLLLAAARKLSLIPAIYKVYGGLYYQDKGIDQVTIRSARILDMDEESRVIEKLIQKKDKAVSVEFEHEKKLIAGMQVIEKCYFIDYSLKNYLETLKKTLINVT